MRRSSAVHVELPRFTSPPYLPSKHCLRKRLLFTEFTPLFTSEALTSKQCTVYVRNSTVYRKRLPLFTTLYHGLPLFSRLRFSHTHHFTQWDPAEEEGGCHRWDAMAGRMRRAPRQGQRRGET